MDLKEGNIWAKAAAVCIILAFLLHLISFGSPHWAKSNPMSSRRKDHIGIWKYCSYTYGGKDVCDDFIDVIAGDWLKAVQSFMTLGFFGLMACIGLVIFYVIDDQSNIARIGALGSTAATGIFMLIAVGVWGGKYSEWFETKEPHLLFTGMLSWAFGVGVASCFLVFITFALVIVGIIAERDAY